jgi:radical SAM-linked protein
MRYVGHLDTHKVWERLVRRAKLPIAYSEGFHPQPKMNQAAPLPLGVIGLSEIVDIWLKEDMAPEDIQDALQNAAPSGLNILKVTIIDLTEKKVQTQVIAAEYRIEMLIPFAKEDLKSKIDNIRNAERIIRERRKKEYDLRPLIEAIELAATSEECPAAINLRLTAKEGATGRPDEVLLAMDIDPNDARIIRTKLIVKEKKTSPSN